jgi:RimJ/RimL family protein N-acetyltransferase
MRLLRYSGLWDFLGYGYWAVEDRVSGRYLGQLGFADFKRGLIGFEGRYPEAGWVIDAAVAGRGLATEGMQAACDWLDGSGVHPRSFCIISADNPASLRVADKLGFSFGLDAELGEQTVGVYVRDAA